MTKKRTKDSYDFPHFPALYKCALIDSRHGSRIELSKDIKASSLFENIQCAKSLRDGTAILKWEEVDACFIGPSIAPAKTIEFLEDIKDSVRSKDCAFIAVLNAVNEAAAAGLTEAGVHGIIYRPCMRRDFTEGVIKAVIKANGNGTWAGIALNCDFESLLIGTLSLANNVQDSGLGNVTIIQTSSAHEEVNFVLAKAGGELQKIIDGIESGIYRLGVDGQPTSRTTEVINQVVAAILNDTGEMGSSDDFRRFFSESINAWFIDLINMSQHEATVRLRANLLNYEGS